MKIIEKKIAELKPYKLNAKRHPQSQIDGLAEAIKRFGFTQPVVVDKKGVIIIGHGRVEAAKAVGLKAVPCVVRDDLSSEEIRALRLIDNRIAETGWDYEILKKEFANLDFEFEPFKVEFPDLDKLAETTKKEVDFGPGQFLIVVTCVDEKQQRKVYEDLEKRGIDCKLIM